MRKILNLRVFDDNGQRWKKSVVDKNLEVLCVSQVRIMNSFIHFFIFLNSFLEMMHGKPCMQCLD